MFTFPVVRKLYRTTVCGQFDLLHACRSTHLADTHDRSSSDRYISDLTTLPGCGELYNKTKMRLFLAALILCFRLAER